MLKGVVSEALHSIQQHQMPVIVFWFLDHRKSFIEFCNTEKVPLVAWDDRSLTSSPAIYWVDAVSITKSLSISASLSEQVKKGKMVLFFDAHYPLIEKEVLILEKIKEWNQANVCITFCQSLDSAFFKQFVGDKLLPLLDQLGLKEDECLEHKMITVSIANAREKLSKSVTSELTAHSEHAWFSTNKLLI